jgi:hypothetical protein
MVVTSFACQQLASTEGVLMLLAAVFQLSLQQRGPKVTS